MFFVTGLNRNERKRGIPPYFPFTNNYYIFGVSFLRRSIFIRQTVADGRRIDCNGRFVTGLVSDGASPRK